MEVLVKVNSTHYHNHNYPVIGKDQWSMLTGKDDKLRLFG